MKLYEQDSSPRDPLSRLLGMNNLDPLELRALVGEIESIDPRYALTVSPLRIIAGVQKAAAFVSEIIENPTLCDHESGNECNLTLITALTRSLHKLAYDKKTAVVSSGVSFAGIERRESQSTDDKLVRFMGDPLIPDALKIGLVSDLSINTWQVALLASFVVHLTLCAESLHPIEKVRELTTASEALYILSDFGSLYPHTLPDSLWQTVNNSLVSVLSADQSVLRGFVVREAAATDLVSPCFVDLQCMTGVTKLQALFSCYEDSGHSKLNATGTPTEIDRLSGILQTRRAPPKVRDILQLFHIQDCIGGQRSQSGWPISLPEYRDLVSLCMDNKPPTGLRILDGSWVLVKAAPLQSLLARAVPRDERSYSVTDGRIDFTSEESFFDALGCSSGIVDRELAFLSKLREGFATGIEAQKRFQSTKAFGHHLLGLGLGAAAGAVVPPFISGSLGQVELQVSAAILGELTASLYRTLLLSKEGKRRGGLRPES